MKTSRNSHPPHSPRREEGGRRPGVGTWSRRDFLKTAGAATLSGLAAGYPRVLLAQEAEEKIKAITYQGKPLRG